MIDGYPPEILGGHDDFLILMLVFTVVGILVGVAWDWWRTRRK